MTARHLALVPLLAAALGLALPAGAAAEPIAIIVDRDNPKTDISLEELKSFYTGRRGDWPDGVRAVPLDLEAGSPGSPAREAFLWRVLGLSPRAQQIGDVIASVRELAEQSSLLALSRS